MATILDSEKGQLSRLTLIAIEAALQAGELLRKGFGTSFQISSKSGTHNLVTEYDHRSETEIIQFLQQHTPGASFLSEEIGTLGPQDNSQIWIIDPLDGTVNFAHQIPIFAVSIALEEEGMIQAGVTYQPITHELFVAEKGKGAFLNGHPIRVSATRQLHQAILSTGFPYNLAENPFQCNDHFVDILKLGLPIRRLGAATVDLAYTASGRYDAFFEASLAPWDCAVGRLLLEESGGALSEWDLSDFDIRSYRPICASNGLIHREISAVLSRTLQ